MTKKNKKTRTNPSATAASTAARQYREREALARALFQKSRTGTFREPADAYTLFANGRAACHRALKSSGLNDGDQIQLAFLSGAVAYELNAYMVKNPSVLVTLDFEAANNYSLTRVLMAHPGSVEFFQRHLTAFTTFMSEHVLTVALLVLLREEEAAA
jgi:hypothetical protein